MMVAFVVVVEVVVGGDYIVALHPPVAVDLLNAVGA